MPGAEISAIKGGWKGGKLVIEDYNGLDVMVIGVPSTGVRAIPAGYVTVVTTSVTLSQTYEGRTILANASTTLTFTLPYANSTSTFAKYHIVNGASSGNMAIIVLTAATTDTFVGCGWASTAVPYQLTNTAATAECGDSITLMSGNSTTSLWHVQGLVGTWVSTT
jgi:hypothetical protein